MYKAKDGKSFGNHEMGKHYDKTRPAAPHHAKEPKDSGGEGEQDMNEVVAEHGPAQHMEMISHHQDGHKHKAVHHDAESAHQHVSTAFQEEPQGEQGGGAPAMAGALPGMAE